MNYKTLTKTSPPEPGELELTGGTLPTGGYAPSNVSSVIPTSPLPVAMDMFYDNA